MSFYNPDELRAASDPNLRFKPRREVFALSRVRFDTLLQFNLLYKKASIYNNDAINSATFRKEPSGDLITIPPNSVALIEEWGAFLEVNPNAATGTGLIEFDLVTQDEARRR